MDAPEAWKTGAQPDDHTPPLDGCLERARRGDLGAFRDLMIAHQSRVFSVALRFTGQRSDAEELLQDVFLQLHAALSQITGEEHLTRWLLRTVTHRCIDRQRHADRRPRLVPIAAMPPTFEPVAAERDADPLMSSRLHGLLLQLAPDARAVMLLRFQQDLDPAEIAALLPMPVATVKSHLRRSLEWLRSQHWREINMELEQRLRQALQLNEPGPAPLEAVMVRLSASPGPAPRGKRRGTVRTVIIGSVLLAAAAAMLVIKPGAGPAPQVAAAPLSASGGLPATAPEPERIAPTEPLAPEPSAPPAQPAMANAASLRDLPLFPMPERSVSVTTEELGWQKAVERHPELVDGPDTDDAFYVALAMQRNGNVINSAARLVNRQDLEVVSNEMRRLMPRNFISALDSPFLARHTRMADGRMLRADAFIFIVIVADDYDASGEDATRSSAKVEQLVRDRYAHLFLPTSGTELNRLTLFLTEAGAVEREKVELTRRAEPLPVPAPMPSPAELLRIAAEVEQQRESLVAATAQRIADQLGVPTDRIGLMGNLRVEQGMKGLTEDPNGVLVPFDESAQLLVSYAWPRREGETGPTTAGRRPTGFAEGLRRELEEKEKRLAPAVIIVEQVMPDAFELRNSEAGMPVVGLTARGETLGAIRLNTRGNEQLSGRALGIELQKVDARFGSRMGMSKMETLTNEAGRTADVMFVWLDPEPSPATSVN